MTPPGYTRNVETKPLAGGLISTEESGELSDQWQALSLRGVARSPELRSVLWGQSQESERKTVTRLTGPRVYRYLGIASEPSVGQWLMLFPAG